MNQVVARCQDGRVLKGLTNDFFPAKDRFHLLPAGSPAGAVPVEVVVSSLKAVFFVHDLKGSPDHKKTNAFDHALPGRKIRVVFKDGEVLVGTTNGYQPGRPGFFLFPADSKSNNERCYIVSASAKEITFL
jgi:hypothetical protein